MHMNIPAIVAAIALTVSGSATAHAATTTEHRPAVHKITAPSWAPFGTKPCKEEDSDGPCYWDAGKVGNGYGTSFYVIPLSKTKKSYTYPSKPKMNEVTDRDY